MIVILDNGHGVDCPGKRSPLWGGKRLFEYEFNRNIVSRIARMLEDAGISYHILVPESTDIPLGERCRRANAIYEKDKDSFLISVHANAGGGTGWECFTSVGQTKSDKIATIIYEEAEKEFPGWRSREDWEDGDPDKEAHFYILKHTKCPAVLTENFFMDTEKDCLFIMSDEGRERVAKMHVEAIKRVINLIKTNGL